jgi:hypothetical protein
MRNAGSVRLVRQERYKKLLQLTTNLTFIPDKYWKGKEVPVFNNTPIRSLWGVQVLILNLQKLRIAYIAFHPHYGPWVGSASNINEYQESSSKVKSGRRVRLTTLPPSVSRLYRKCGASTSHSPMGLQGLLQGQLYLLSSYNI